MNARSFTFSQLTLSALLFASTALAADWPQWRGPQRDGVIRGEKPLDKLPAAPKPAWQVPAGPGHSAVVISGPHLAYLDEINGQEHAHLIDLATHKQIWDVAYAEPAEYSGYGTGPRCTPVIDGDRIYIQSGRGEFRCLALADGKTIWRMNFEKDYGATYFGNTSSDQAAKDTAARRHGNNGAPVIDGARIFIPVGSPEKGTLIAFDKMTGKQLWAVGNDNTAYSSLVVATLAGTRQVVHFTADALMGVEVATGKMLWRVPIRSNSKRHVFTPLIVGDTVTVASATIGLIRYQVAKVGANFTCKPLWENKEMKINISTSVLVGEKLYGIGVSRGKQSDFACVDFKTGHTLWTHGGFDDYASVLAIGNRLLALNSTGEMFMLAANPAKYEELGRAQVCGKTWSFPAYVNGTLYVRDDRQIAALPMGPQVAP